MIIIALDGPAGAGKTTVGLAVARALGINFVETGKIYRALALKALRRGINLDDTEALAALCKDTEIRYAMISGSPAVFLDGEEVTRQLHTPEIGAAASALSAHPDVRAALLPLQRALVKPPGVVMEGRDIGTVVLPEAPFKFFLDASLAARAERRARDLERMGEGIEIERVAADIAARDNRDAGRDCAPLRRAEDAIYIDTTNMTLEEVVGFILGVVRRGNDDAYRR